MIVLKLLDVILCRYVRAEVLAGFVNGLFLLFIAFFILSEAVEVILLSYKQCGLCLLLLPCNPCQ